jgi:hypothetical protein
MKASEFNKAADRGRPASACSPSSFFELRLSMQKPIKNLQTTVESILSSPPANLSQLNHLTKKEVMEHSEVLWLQIPKSVVELIKAFDLAGAELREIDGAVEALDSGSNGCPVSQPASVRQNGENPVNCVWIRLVITSVHIVKKLANVKGSNDGYFPENSSCSPARKLKTDFGEGEALERSKAPKAMQVNAFREWAGVSVRWKSASG